MMAERFSKLVGELGSEIPCVLAVTEFFAARAPEVVQLYSAAKPKYSVTPRYLRRRLRSFRPYFNKPKKSSKVSEPRVLSRRSRRSRRMYLDQEGKRWLSCTHVWHAKRFHMGEMWGMRLPLNVCNKGRRAILRTSKRGCLIHDRSYMDCWVMDGHGAVDKLKVEGFSGHIGHPRVLSGEIMCSEMLFVNDRLVTPYQVIWKDHGAIVHLYTHPAARSEVEDILGKVGAKLSERCVRFELIGATVPSLVKTIFNLDVLKVLPGRLAQAEDIGVTLHVRAGGNLVDVFFDESVDAFGYWMRLVRSGGSAIGVLDRHCVVRESLVPDFPFDFPTSKSGAIQTALVAKKMLNIDNKRPNQYKLDQSCVESTFFPDWSLLGLDRIPVLGSTKAVKVEINRGSIRWNAHLYRDGRLIGYVTSSCSEARSVGIAHIMSDCELGECIIRNPGSKADLVGNLSPCSLVSTDSLLLGLK